MNEHSEEDEDAMRRLAQGEDSALNELMDRWQVRLLTFLGRMTGNEAVAHDLAQETFVRVYQNRTKYRSRSRFSSWLFQIAANLARQQMRWTSRHPAVSLDAAIPGQDFASADPEPAESMVKHERAAAVRDAVLALPIDLREAVLLAEFEDLPQLEIARILGCSRKAVESRLYRARAILRDTLSRHLR